MCPAYSLLYPVTPKGRECLEFSGQLVKRGLRHLSLPRLPRVPLSQRNCALIDSGVMVHNQVEAVTTTPNKSSTGTGFAGVVATDLTMFIRTKPRLSSIAISTALCFGLASEALSGPPFVTDDPQPVDYQHWEFYIASMHSELGGDWSGKAPRTGCVTSAPPNRPRSMNSALTRKTWPLRAVKP